MTARLGTRRTRHQLQLFEAAAADEVYRQVHQQQRLLNAHAAKFYLDAESAPAFEAAYHLFTSKYDRLREEKDTRVVYNRIAYSAPTDDLTALQARLFKAYYTEGDVVTASDIEHVDVLLDLLELMLVPATLLKFVTQGGVFLYFASLDLPEELRSQIGQLVAGWLVEYSELLNE